MQGPVKESLEGDGGSRQKYQQNKSSCLLAWGEGKGDKEQIEVIERRNGEISRIT